MDAVNTAEGAAFEPAYARFLPRFRALVIDSIIMVVVLFATLLVAVAIRSENLARVLGFTVAAVWLLYEPLLVCLIGGTIGHRRSNLRVVDDRTHGNVSFAKAVARTVIKGVLGWVSFISMLTTRRSQAVHDLLTRSTVQIRDQARAGPSLYVRERQEFASPAMPSRTRRAAVIAGYLLVSTVLSLFVYALFGVTGFISQACVYYDRCSRLDNLFSLVALAVWLVLCLGSLALGWRGRLYGCRAG